MQFNLDRRVFLTGTLCALFCTISFAQERDTTAMRELMDVEVIEKRRPSVMRESVPVQVMDRSRIERLGLQEVSEAVKRFSGVTVRDYGGIGGLKTVSVRGLGSQHTAVSYDGVSISDVQNGQIDIGRFSLENVESISLTIGQADDIFQTARMYASAGGLNIRTLRPHFDDKPFVLTGEVKTGSFGLINPGLRYEQKLADNYAVTVYTDWLKADGRYPYVLTNGNLITNEKRTNSDIETIRTELNVYADWKSAGKMQVKAYWFDSDRGLPGSVILYNDNPIERLHNKNVFVQAVYENKLSERFSLKGNLKYDYGYTRYQEIHSKYATGEQTDVYTQREYYGSVAGLYSFSPFFSVSFAEDFFVNTLYANTPSYVHPVRYTSLTSLAAQYQNSRFTFTASLLNTYITEDVKIGTAAPDRKRLSPAVSLSYRIFRDYNWRIRASYKDIFRNPTFIDLYYDRMGTKTLESEKAKEYNLGVTWSGDIPVINAEYFSFSVDGYYNRIKDKIVAYPTMFVWKMQNRGKVKGIGININHSSQFALSSAFSIKVEGAYNWQNVEDIYDPDLYGHQLPYLPFHSGTTALSFVNPWVHISWLTTFVGERYFASENSKENSMQRYVDHQLSFNRAFKWKNVNIKLHAEILNLFDVSYDVIKYYPMPGRSFRMGLKIIY